MSWDIYLEAPLEPRTCGHCDGTGKTQERDQFFESNYTSNMWGMLKRAEFDWDLINGKTGEYALPLVQELIVKMKANPKEYRALNPSNGWGDYDSFLKEFLEPIAESCRDHPDAIIRVSR